MNKLKFNEFDVIKKAIDVINSQGDNFPCSMGTYCPFCCISTAKGILDREFDCELPFSTLVRDVMTDNVIERDSDMPLVNARKIIDETIGKIYGKLSGIYKFTKKETLNICEKALSKEA